MCLHDKAFKIVYYSPATWEGLFVSSRKASISPGLLCQVSKRCLFEWGIKEETVSHPINALKNQGTTDFVGQSDQTILWMGAYLRLVPTPNVINISETPIQLNKKSQSQSPRCPLFKLYSTHTLVRLRHKCEVKGESQPLHVSITGWGSALNINRKQIDVLYIKINKNNKTITVLTPCLTAIDNWVWKIILAYLILIVVCL